MADAMVLNVERRERAGKGAARAARRAGRVPGVIYGSKKSPENVSIDPRELLLELRKPGFFTNLYSIKLDGSSQQVLVRDVQVHPVTDRPVHVDLLRVDPNTKVTVEVPVICENEGASPGLKRGGVLNIVRHTIEVVCFATQIPHEIRVDLTGLEINDSVHISKIGLPEGVRPTIARDFTVVTVAAPSTMAAEAETATPAAAAPVEVITAKKPEEGAEGGAGAEKGKEAKKG